MAINARPCRDAGVEHGHPALVLDQVDVHRPIGLPPRTTQTPAAIRSASAPCISVVEPGAERWPAWPAASAPWSRPAAASRAGARCRRCRCRRRCRRSARRLTVSTSQPSIATRAPLGAKPWNVPGPAKVPAALQRTAVRVRVGHQIDDLEMEVGEGGEHACEVLADHRRARRAPRRRRSGRPPRPATGRRPVEIVRRQRVEIPLGDLGGGGHRPAAVYAPPISCVAMTKQRELGRGERVLPGLWRLRLPLPWPGVPHCNAWAIAAGSGIVLVDTGMHQPGSMAQLERAMAQVNLRVEHVRLLVITHAHSDHWGQAAPIIERAGCPMWMHPNHAHAIRARADPQRALARRIEVGRQSGVPEEALRRLRRAAPGTSRRASPLSWPSPTGTSSPGSRSTPTLARGRSTRPRGTPPRTCACSSASAGC